MYLEKYDSVYFDLTVLEGMLMFVLKELNAVRIAVIELGPEHNI